MCVSCQDTQARLARLETDLARALSDGQRLRALLTAAADTAAGAGGDSAGVSPAPSAPASPRSADALLRENGRLRDKVAALRARVAQGGKMVDVTRDQLSSVHATLSAENEGLKAEVARWKGVAAAQPATGDGVTGAVGPEGGVVGAAGALVVVVGAEGGGGLAAARGLALARATSASRPALASRGGSRPVTATRRPSLSRQPSADPSTRAPSGKRVRPVSRSLQAAMDAVAVAGTAQDDEAGVAQVDCRPCHHTFCRRFCSLHNALLTTSL